MASDREALLAALGVNIPDSPPYVDPAISAAAPPNVPSMDTLAHLREQNRAREDAQAKQLRDAVTPFAKRAATVGVQALPMLAATPGFGGLVGTTAGIVEGAKPGTLASLAPAREQIREKAGPPLALKAYPGDGDLKPMNTYEEVMPSKTLSQMAGAAPSGGGMGGGGGISDAKLRAAQLGQMNGLTEAGNLQRELGIDQALQAQEMSGRRAMFGQQMQTDAERQAQIDADAAQRHDAFLARQEQLANEIAQLKTDPGRLLRNADTGTQFTFALGAVLGGMNSPGGGNSSLDRLDKLIDRDIQSQIQEIDSKKSSFNARNSLFSQMLAETGDRRMAAMQTRKLMYDAADMKLKADAERLGIPILRDNAAIAAQVFDQKRAELNVAIEQASLQQARAAAAAAASAAEAANQRAWQRQVEMIKLDLEQQKINADRSKAGGEIDKQTQQLGDKLSDKELANGRSAVDNTKRRLDSLPNGEGLPGLGKVGDIRAGLKPKLDGPTSLVGIVPRYAADKLFGLNDEERVSRSDWNRMKLAYQNQITGSGGSDAEGQRIAQAFEGDLTPAEQRNAVKQADDYFARREAAIKAGFDPRVVQTFEQRQNAYNPQLPPGAKERR